ncbi:hypothetical protein HA466_0262700 [Hirschfeldia incana]|nr:hypothetical protein HA466_0262700 [Hirschfeldia incana]
MRRLTSVFGGAAEPPKGGNPESNTLISDMTTMICLDDYHSLDRTGRKEKGVTALDPRANDFDLMYEQIKALKSGIAIEKPIYNHVTGLLDAPELRQSPKIVIEGLHPMFDERVRELLDFSIYLDISNEVKFAWKIQRDMAERGHSLESIKASIKARKPDFDAFIDPQKQYADAVIEVLPMQLIPDDNEGKVLRVRLIMKEGVKYFSPVYLFDEGSTISWISCGRKLTCLYPGIKFNYEPDTYFDHEVSKFLMVIDRNQVTSVSEGRNHVKMRKEDSPSVKVMVKVNCHRSGVFKKVEDKLELVDGVLVVLEVDSGCVFTSLMLKLIERRIVSDGEVGSDDEGEEGIYGGEASDDEGIDSEADSNEDEEYPATNDSSGDEEEQAERLVNINMSDGVFNLGQLFTGEEFKVNVTHIL